MSKSGTNIPKRRFPEFVGEPEWEEKALADLADITMGQSPDSNSYNTIKKGKPLIQGNADLLNHKTNPRIWTSKATKECRIGDIILTVRAPVGAVAKSLHNACIGRGVCSLTPNEQNEFLYQFLLIQEERWDSYSQGSTFTAINSNDIKKFKLLAPKPKEQKKIADCLTFVDNLILLSSKKVEALKEHKKGLMQQLFPQDGEGEAVPERRFSEFKSQWNIKEIGKCFDNIGGTTLERFVSEKGDYYFISIGNYSKDGKYIDKKQRIKLNDNTKSKLLNKNDLVMVLNDKTLTGDIIGSTLLINEDNKYIYNQRSERLIIKPDSKLNPLYAWYILNSNLIRKRIFDISQGGTQIYVNFSNVKKINIYIPDLQEQEKIVSCLSSLENLIANQTQKVEVLKEHKKGLMQQLFPNSETDK